MRWTDDNFGLSLMVLSIELSKEFDPINVKGFCLVTFPGFEKDNTIHSQLLDLFQFFNSVFEFLNKVILLFLDTIMHTKNNYNYDQYYDP